MNSSPSPHQNNGEGVGPFVAIIIVVILMALGGIYFFITQEMKLHSTPASEQTPNS